MVKCSYEDVVITRRQVVGCSFVSIWRVYTGTNACLLREDKEKYISDLYPTLLVSYAKWNHDKKWINKHKEEWFVFYRTIPARTATKHTIWWWVYIGVADRGRDWDLGVLVVGTDNPTSTSPPATTIPIWASTTFSPSPQPSLLLREKSAINDLMDVKYRQNNDVMLC